MNPPKKAIGLSLPIQLGRNGYFAANETTIQQVSDNIQNLLLTRPGERRFNNQFGSGLYNLLFQMIDFDVSKDIITDTIQRDVDNFLPGVNIINVDLSQQQPENKDTNSIFISITFRYNNTVGKTEVSLTNNKI